MPKCLMPGKSAYQRWRSEQEQAGGPREGGVSLGRIAALVPARGLGA